MRKRIVWLVLVCASAAVPTLAPPASADSCKGDLYCDGLPKPCRLGELVHACSAGDASVDDTLP